jgi:lipoate-protein ligase A
MQKRVDHKIKNGKLLQIEADLDNDTITSITITGDFFIHPESAIDGIEATLKNSTIRQARERLETFIRENDVKIIGFSVTDIITILEEIHTSFRTDK